MPELKAEDLDDEDCRFVREAAVAIRAAMVRKEDGWAHEDPMPGYDYRAHISVKAALELLAALREAKCA
jgi:hypothetical protein